MATCPECNGKGAQTAIAGHCFDIDGGLWHEPGKCKSPEHCRPATTCCPPCPMCDGTGKREGTDAAD